MENPVAMAETVVLGAIAIPGRGEQVRVARAFVAGVLRELAAPEEAAPDERVLDEAVLDNATLLTSELVTNAIRHSRSGESGGTVGLMVVAMPDGIRVEVTDSGSAASSPVVKQDSYTCDGHGLFLVEAVAREWGCRRSDAGTTVWFCLGLPGG
ncbi:MAG TPA: ATP-binding protein [Streptosporangiaceae bacterium]|nr:ATP-binding protein [Streptosporangiaceae bacterium]